MTSLHFVGIGGTGLSAIARVMLERGASVSGSDIQLNTSTCALAADGARITLGHQAANVHGADLVIISSAIKPDNPEVVEARRLGIPVVKRAEFLPQVMGGQKQICIAGTHGKTTTTAMIAMLLTAADLDPSFIIGGNVPELGTNAHAGRGSHFVIEADEYDRMFLGLQPWIAIITSLELDHVDCYPTVADIYQAFAEFAGRVQADGTILACADQPAVLEVAQASLAIRPASQRPSLLTYSLDAQADWRAVELTSNQRGGTSFRVLRSGQPVGEYALSIPGRHNVSNALAAIAVGTLLGLPAELMANTLSRFQGAQRRFEIRGEAGGVTVIDDYAHHPTEIRATLAAARQRFGGRRIWAVFQPHTYSRTRKFFEDFTRSFADADRVLLTDIYAARERDEGDVSVADLAKRIIGPKALYTGGIAPTSEYLMEHVAPGDVIITLSAGDGNQIGELVLARLSGSLPRENSDGG